jgi:hypothetical protein
VGFFDWDTAGPSTREVDLAFSTIAWIGTYDRSEDEPLDLGDYADRSRRLHLLLDAYEYDGDRQAFRTAVAQRARRQAGVIRELAEAGNPSALALLPLAGHLDRTALAAEKLPDDFWVR